MKKETIARKFNESVDYFTLNYGDPFKDCAINLLASYRDMASVSEPWANTTITKTIMRMPKSIVKNVFANVNSPEMVAKFGVRVFKVVIAVLTAANAK